MPDSADEADKIEKAAIAPAVGSMAFFSSMLINGFKNYKNYGFPAHVFTRSDWLLMSLPVVVVVVALSDIFMNGETYD